MNTCGTIPRTPVESLPTLSAPVCIGNGREWKGMEEEWKTCREFPSIRLVSDAQARDAWMGEAR